MRELIQKWIIYSPDKESFFKGHNQWSIADLARIYDNYSDAIMACNQIGDCHPVELKFQFNPKTLSKKTDKKPATLIEINDISTIQSLEQEDVLIKEYKNHIKGYGFLSDLGGRTLYGIDREELDTYSKVWAEFTEDKSAPKYCADKKRPSLYDIPYTGIPKGTLRVYGRLK